jgi:germination protein M
MTSHRTSLARAIVLIATLAFVAACAPGTGVVGPVATPPPSSAPSVEPGSPEPTAPASPTPSPIGSPEPSPSGEPGDTVTIRVYFFLGSFTHEGGLAPILYEIPKTQAVATAAMEFLLDGPSDMETNTRPAFYTTIPEGTRLLGLSIENGIATVDLSREFESGGGSASVLGRLAQVVYTLTQFPTVNEVTFELDGEPVTVFSGEGVVLDEPVGRADYYDQLPAIWVDRPAWGAALGNPARVTGLSNTFEATLRIAILDADEDVIVDEMTTATCGTGCWGTFDVTLEYDVDVAQWGTLRVYADSAQDGSPIDVTDYPVWLTPHRN